MDAFKDPTTLTLAIVAGVLLLIPVAALAFEWLPKFVLNVLICYVVLMGMKFAYDYTAIGQQ